MLLRRELNYVNLNLFLVSSINVWNNIIFQEVCWACIHKPEYYCIIKRYILAITRTKSSRTKGWILLLLLLTVMLTFSKVCIINPQREVFQKQIYQADTKFFKFRFLLLKVIPKVWYSLQPCMFCLYLKDFISAWQH